MHIQSHFTQLRLSHKTDISRFYFGREFDGVIHVERDGCVICVWPKSAVVCRRIPRSNMGLPHSSSIYGNSIMEIFYVANWNCFVMDENQGSRLYELYHSEKQIYESNDVNVGEVEGEAKI